MTVYRPKKSSYYHFDFVISGKRYTGSTGQRLVKAAREVETKKRRDAALGLLDDAAQYSLDVAFGRWWTEKGQFTEGGKRTHPDKPSPLEERLDRLLDIMDRSIKVAEVDQTVVAAAIEKRRGIVTYRSKKKGAKGYLPANATVNRDVISLLRPVLKRAASHWGAKGLPVINWGDLSLDEPRETVRVYGSAEEARWMDEATRTGWYKGKTAREDAADLSLALDLVLTYGLRLSELFFPPTAFTPAEERPDGACLIWMKGRKKDVPHTVELLDEHVREIAARLGRAVAAGLPHIWHYEKANGDLVAITKGGLQERLNNAADRAGVTAGRRIHGGRHHALTAIYRHTKDIKLTGQAGGHLDPASTMRYVHADKGGVRTALLEMKSRNSPEPRTAQGGKRR